MSARSSQPHVAVTGRRTDGRRPAPPATEIVPTATRRNRRRLFPPFSFVSFLEFWTGAKPKRRGTTAAWRLAWCQNRSAVEQPPLCLAPVCLSWSRSLPNLTHSFHPGVVQSFQPGQRSLQTCPRFRAQPLQQSPPLPSLSPHLPSLCPVRLPTPLPGGGGEEESLIWRPRDRDLAREDRLSTVQSGPRPIFLLLASPSFGAVAEEVLQRSVVSSRWTGLASTTNSAQDSERVCAFVCGIER